jgi:hypothetical protein
MSANKSLAYNVKPKYGAAGSAVGTVTGPAIDTAGYQEACVVLAVGAVVATGSLSVAKVQDSADGSTGWADVSGAAFTAVADSGDNQAQIGMLKLDGNLAKRYIRVVTTVATAAADHGVAVLLVNGQYNPQQTPVFTV